MSTVIRLSRVGAKGEYRYHVVVTTKRSKRDGKAIEVIGAYTPSNNKTAQFSIKMPRYTYWTSKGAVPSDTVTALVAKSTK